MNIPYFEIVTAIFLSYLLGSLSSAIIVCKAMGLPDPRTQGSHNPGATNVLRIGGKLPAIITLLGDVLKGVVPVLIARWLGATPTTMALAALAAFIGHLYPVFFRFAGGKGVATALGGLLALNWPAGLCWMGTWALVALLFRYSSLAALVASLLAPFYIGWFTGRVMWVVVIAIMSAMLILRHHRNIAKLIQGKEAKI